ncbi:MAG TPA: hypothetical protein VKV77_06055 [Methylovirgula sp.]|nr:hypothetical protein [Methylovirgula sp.]
MNLSLRASLVARPLAALGLGVAAMIGAASAARATDIFSENPVPVFAGPTDNPVEDYFLHWFDRVNEAQATQPHWMTPLATVTPRLEQEIRYDQSLQQLGNGADVINFDGGKGLELIPTTMNEILINAPNYEERYVRSPAQAFGDWNFLTVKQRIVSEPEDKGNYIVSTFLGVQAPMLSSPFTNKAWMITPTLAAGKGFGDFDIQATVGVPVPLSHESTIGTSLATNVAFQYHIAQYFWPEVELNDTYWFDGQRAHLNQLFVTPGIIFGRFKIGQDTPTRPINLIVGVGYQVAVTPPIKLTPALTPTFDHGWLMTARMSF